jgi:hypothetical protein
MTHVYVLSYWTDYDGDQILDVFGTLEAAQADERVGHWKDQYEAMEWERPTEDRWDATKPKWYQGWTVRRFEVRTVHIDGRDDAQEG